MWTFIEVISWSWSWFWSVTALWIWLIAPLAISLRALYVTRRARRQRARLERENAAEGVRREDELAEKGEGGCREAPAQISPCLKIDKLAEDFSAHTGRVNCCKPFDGGRKLLIGTDAGVFVKDGPAQAPTKISLRMPAEVLDCTFATQLEIMEKHNLLVILADGLVYSFPFETSEHSATTNTGRKICHAQFIQTGTCDGETLLCCVKSSSLSSTTRLFHWSANGAGLTPYKEFYIPAPCSSIHLLPTKLCLACPDSFKIVSLETLDHAPLLDDTDLASDLTGEETSKPVYMAQNREMDALLLCYQKFSFYVDRFGKRARGNWKISWRDYPYAFATLREGRYIIALWLGEGIEVRDSDSGGVVGSVDLRITRFLHEGLHEVMFAYEDDSGHDVIASLSVSLTG